MRGESKENGKRLRRSCMVFYIMSARSLPQIFDLICSLDRHKAPA